MRTSARASSSAAVGGRLELRLGCKRAGQRYRGGVRRRGRGRAHILRLAGSRPTKPMSTALFGKLSPTLVLVPHLCDMPMLPRLLRRSAKRRLRARGRSTRVITSGRSPGFPLVTPLYSRFASSIWRAISRSRARAISRRRLHARHIVPPTQAQPYPNPKPEPKPEPNPTPNHSPNPNPNPSPKPKPKPNPDQAQQASSRSVARAREVPRESGGASSRVARRSSAESP